jgi:TolB protein
VRRLFAALLLTAAVVTVGAVPASGGSYPGTNGLIVFTRQTITDGLVENIWTIDPTTGVETQLTSDPEALDEQPEWSPDGTRIAFSRDELSSSGAEIWVMNADGSDPHQVSPDPGGGDTCPTWSPDGTLIAFSDGGGTITIIPADGGVPLVTLPVGTCFLSWSPLGDLIAFDRGNGIEVIAPVDGAVPHAVTTDPSDGFSTWSPDGTRIAFSRVLAGGEIVIMSVLAADGSDPVMITDPSEDLTDLDPAWSPDGTRITFERLDNVTLTAHLFTVPASGGTPVLLTAPVDEQLDVMPDWQPIPIDPPPPPLPPTPRPVVIEPTFTG